MTSFVDTSFFFALASADDPDHERVRKVFEDFDPKRLPDLWLTTNHVVMETIRLTKRQIGQEPAVQMGRRLYSERLARIHWTTPNEEREAFDYLPGNEESAMTIDVDAVYEDGVLKPERPLALEDKTKVQ